MTKTNKDTKPWKDLESTEEGLINTSNKQGYMLAEPDDLMKEFAEFCAKDGRVGADIGCAYGVATLHVLQQMEKKKVQGKIIAVDPSKKHIAKLQELAATQGLDKQLETRCAIYPQDTTFKPSTIDAILLSRILHFLTGKQIEEVFKVVFKALKPGGKIYISTITPYIACLVEFVDEYEANLKRFLKKQNKQQTWPGEIGDLQKYLKKSSQKNQNPNFFHAMSPAELQQALKKTGFQVELAEFSTRPYPDNVQYEHNGTHQEDAILIAKKPTPVRLME
jgi:SAM-dependent methyltransferase